MATRKKTTAKPVTEEIRFDDIDNDLDFDEPVEELVEEVVEPTPEPEEEKDPKHAEYLMVFDAMMFEGMYEKTYQIGSNYSLTLRTRSTDADLSITRQLDKMELSTIAAFTSASAVLSLSHSLMEFGGVDYRDMEPKVRYAKIRELPSQVITIISKKLAEFDTYIKEVMEYGEENF